MILGERFEIQSFGNILIIFKTEFNRCRNRTVYVLIKVLYKGKALHPNTKDDPTLKPLQVFIIGGAGFSIRGRCRKGQTVSVCLLLLQQFLSKNIWKDDETMGVSMTIYI